VANVKLNRPWTPEKLRNAINGNLWRDIRIIQAEKAEDNFHARFSAHGKSYVYRIVNAPVMSPFWRRFALHETRPLDVARMNMAARLLLGEHDWTAFSSALSESESKVRNVTECGVNSIWDKRANTNIIEFHIRANGFLRYMVRSIMGTLLEVGRGEKDSDTILAALSGRDRSLAGQTAPACGLTLVKVDY
jgi:tRNA pseudouridine38-40 synthase